MRSATEKSERKAEYRRYINGAVWKAIHKEVLTARGSICEDCGGVDRIQVHHLKYPEVLGTETPDMLRVLCHTCHTQYHPDKPYGPRKKKRVRVKVTDAERKANRRLRLAARRQRRADKLAGKRPKPVPSNASLLAVVRAQ